MITQEKLKELLEYNEMTGVFTWRTPRRRVKVGAVAGCIGDTGYWVIRLDGSLYKAHRLAWLYVHGEFPSAHIDHIDCDKLDNRMSNLRNVTNAQNLQNRKQRSSASGYRGVYWNMISESWYVSATLNGKYHYGGYFKDVKDAALAAQELRNRVFTHNIEQPI